MNVGCFTTRMHVATREKANRVGVPNLQYKAKAAIKCEQLFVKSIYCDVTFIKNGSLTIIM